MIKLGLVHSSCCKIREGIPYVYSILDLVINGIKFSARIIYCSNQDSENEQVWIFKLCQNSIFRDETQFPMKMSLIIDKILVSKTPEILKKLIVNNPFYGHKQNEVSFNLKEGTSNLRRTENGLFYEVKIDEEFEKYAKDINTSLDEHYSFLKHSIETTGKVPKYGPEKEDNSTIILQSINSPYVEVIPNISVKLLATLCCKIRGVELLLPMEFSQNERVFLLCDPKPGSKSLIYPPQKTINVINRMLLVEKDKISKLIPENMYPLNSKEIDLNVSVVDDELEKNILERV